MFAVTILGNNSALPMHDRHPTSQVLNLDDQTFLIDCGEGTQVQMNRYKIRRSRITNIFISHLHGDHYFGLFGLLNSLSLTNRTEQLNLFAPAPLEPILMDVFRVADTNLSYPLVFHPLKEEGMIWEGSKMTVSCFKVFHRIECWGFLFREKEKLRKVDLEQTKQFQIPSAFFPKLKEGQDYTRPNGEVVKNEWVTRPAPHARSYAYCADTRYEPSLCDIISKVDLVYHESTYLQDQAEKAGMRFHSTAAQAAAIAQQAGVKRLLLGHFSSKYTDLDPFFQEASAVFPASELAIEGTTYIVG
jgi:ribonuclease Z